MSDDDSPTDEQRDRTTPDHDAAAVAGPHIDVQWTPADGRRRRYRFRPRAKKGGWWRIEAEWTGCRWRHVGQEVVADVAVRVGTSE